MRQWYSGSLELVEHKETAFLRDIPVRFRASALLFHNRIFLIVIRLFIYEVI